MTKKKEDTGNINSNGKEDIKIEETTKTGEIMAGTVSTSRKRSLIQAELRDETTIEPKSKKMRTE